MASATLERLRSIHEDVEKYERTAVNVLSTKPRNHRDRILHGHRTRILIEDVVCNSRAALDIYSDGDGMLMDEVRAMTGPSLFTSFYDQLKEVRNYHKKYPNQVTHNEISMKTCSDPDLQFTGEERFGKYLDLHRFFDLFLNVDAFSGIARPLSQVKGASSLKKDTHIDYISFLSCFHDFTTVPRKKKTQNSYKHYLNELEKYLSDFYKKTQPLVDLDEILFETISRFDNEWKRNCVSGWIRSEIAVPSTTRLYCKPCKRSFASKGVFNGHLTGKKHKRAASSITSTENLIPVDAESKTIALSEIKINKLCELLTEVVAATKSFVELKQTRTTNELQAEADEEQYGAMDDIDIEEFGEEDQGSPFYNPLNLPLGWDGKPIPYWLYKLHGLGVEYKCEICGNHSYWGRRAFDRHFQEWRHAHGMRCLKIPNTKHFHDITLIEDAINLYEKIQSEVKTWKSGIQEEYEDSEGNILNKRTYEDLVRQGLL